MTTADITLVLEGTYPYVLGGVSSWVHQLLAAYPDRRFALMHIAAKPESYKHKAFELPPNVTELSDMYCCGAALPHKPWRYVRQRSRTRKPSRVLDAIRRLHLEDKVDDSLLEDLAAGDLSVAEFLHGQEAFELLRAELYPKLAPAAPFSDFFWHCRALHVPLLRLLSERCPEARLYHAVSTGYAGLVAAVASVRTGRPFVLTEHGIYAREREIELARANWILDATPSVAGGARPSPLRKFWCHFFRMLSRVAYHRATRVLTLSEVNRRRQLADGADPAKSHVVPNGVESELYRNCRARNRPGGDAPFRIGFVGRVVPIKDVVTLIRACSLAVEHTPLEVWIVGPDDEDLLYAERCRTMVASIGLSEQIRFLGRQPMTEIYPQLDAIVLTSISEGQPLVILEAFACALPVIATDVGACRELIEGADDHDRRTGPAGIVTRVANPAETAAALIYLAGDAQARTAMGSAGLARVTERYQQQQVVNRYDQLYDALVTL